MDQLLNNQPLLTKDDQSITIQEALEGVEAVGFYFSAHWCGPCRNFTPKLADVYQSINADRKRWEIIFLSSDNNQSSFDDYRKTMPWVSLNVFDGDNAALKDKLSAKYGVRGIPTLVMLTPQGELITTKGRSGVVNKPEEFPWTPKTFWEIMEGEVINNAGESFDSHETLQTKDAIALYFSAHWCGPCQDFTPKLVETYNKLKESEHNFEVVFVSSDKNQKGFDEYFSVMPWLAIPFGDERKNELSSSFDVEGIPTLIIIDPATGNIINDEGVGRISGDPEGAEFPWRPKPLYNIDEAPGSVLNEKPIFIAFNDSFPNEYIDQLNAIATNYIKQWEEAGEDQKLYFVYADSSNQMYDRLVGFLNLNTDSPQYIILNLSQQQKSVQSGVELNGETADTFIQLYLANADRKSVV